MYGLIEVFHLNLSAEKESERESETFIGGWGTNYNLKQFKFFHPFSLH